MQFLNQTPPLTTLKALDAYQKREKASRTVRNAITGGIIFMMGMLVGQLL